MVGQSEGEHSMNAAAAFCDAVAVCCGSDALLALAAVSRSACSDDHESVLVLLPWLQPDARRELQLLPPPPPWNISAALAALRLFRLKMESHCTYS